MIHAASLRPIVVLFLAVAISACSDQCGNHVARQFSDPTGEHVAVLFQSDCGVTTGYSSHVSLLAEDEEPGEDGNLFVADTNHGAAPPAAAGGPRVEMEWQAPDRLLISYDRRARVFKKVTQLRGVTIDYRLI